MRSQRLGPLDVRITGGANGGGGGGGKVVVLLHGFGAPGDDLVGLARMLDVPGDVRFVFPAAPLELPGFFGPARAWWMIDMERLERLLATGVHEDRSSEVPDGLGLAREGVIAMLDAVEDFFGVSGSDVILGGFSQGSMLACDVALRTERPLAGLVLMSSTLICADYWQTAMPARAGLPVFQSHGRSDHLLPFATAERMRDLLRNAGLEVTWREFPGGHEIPPPVLGVLSQFIGKLAA